MNGVADGLLSTGICFLIAGFVYLGWLELAGFREDRRKYRLSGALLVVGFLGIVAGIWTAVLA